MVLQSSNDRELFAASGALMGLSLFVYVTHVMCDTQH